MGGGDLNLKKSWHPHTMKNQERVWKAEQAKQEEERKLNDLRKEITEERDREQLRRLGENSGVLASSNGGEAKLEWMYKNSAELINREEYLLGRKIDKSFEQLEAEERRQEQSQAFGVKQSINHVEHECVPFSIREYRNLQSTEQVDMQRKTMEDPLMLIKQREMESRRKLLENPVKLKEIHRILKTEREQAAKLEKKSKKRKKSKKKKSKRGSSDQSDDASDDDDLDKKLARQMKKLKGEGGTNDEFKLDKLLDAKYRTLTKQLDMATKQKKNKSKKSSEDSEDSSQQEEPEEPRGGRGRSNSSDDERMKQQQEQRGRRERSRGNRERQGRSHSRDDERGRRERRSRSVEERTKQSKDHRESSKKSKEQRSSHDERTKETRNLKDRRNRRSHSVEQRKKRMEREREREMDRNGRHKRSRSRSSRRDRDREQQPRPRSRSPRRGHSRDKNRTDKRQRQAPSPPASAPAPPATKSKPKLSETEREARLREMMDNAAWREADRTKAVQKHREEYAREEAQNQARGFDKQFINKEVKKAIDNQTSIGNRIRSNLNNIQRTSAAMDANFARK
ncbi:hypothetical protein ACLKA7_004676 [Drosophila subpalustris]